MHNKGEYFSKPNGSSLSYKSRWSVVAIKQAGQGHIMSLSLRRLCSTIMLASVVATLLLSSQMALSAPPLSIPTGIGTPWDITTYCNAPHAIASHYNEPREEGAELVHVSVLMRHHKVMTVHMCLLPAFLIETPSACSSSPGPERA